MQIYPLFKFQKFNRLGRLCNTIHDLSSVLSFSLTNDSIVRIFTCLWAENIPYKFSIISIKAQPEEIWQSSYGELWAHFVFCMLYLIILNLTSPSLQLFNW